MNSWLTWDVATAILGIISGLIFLIDGWRRSPKDVLPFQQTSRISGLSWLVGGGVLTGGFTFLAKEQQSRAFMFYIIFFGLTLIVGLLLCVLILLGYYVSKYYRQKSVRIALTESIPFVIFFVTNGLDALLVRIKEDEQDLTRESLKALEKSRLYVLRFVNDISSYLSSELAASGKGGDYFRYFLANFLRSFAVMFFEEKDVLDKYRAGYFERHEGKLIFVEGADIKGSGFQFSCQPLELSESLAGRAFVTNRILLYPDDSNEGYQKRSAQSPYKRFVVIPVPFKPDTTVDDRIGVLCVDSTDSQAPFTAEFQRSLLIYFSNLISAGHSIYFTHTKARS